MEPYPRCATCKHYKTDPFPFKGGDPHGYGTCTRITQELRTAWVDTDGEHDEPLRLDVENTFGCVLHEPKE